jgi:transcription elongation regulator 1
MSIDTSTPATQTGGRDSLPLRQTVAPASPSALDLIKKKLQDAGASSVPSPLATPSAASELNGSKPADAAPKGQQASSNGEKSKDNNGDGNMSDYSSDSDDEEHGPSKEDCIRQFKVVMVTFLLDSRDTGKAFGLHDFFLCYQLLHTFCYLILFVSRIEMLVGNKV